MPLKKGNNKKSTNDKEVEDNQERVPKKKVVEELKTAEDTKKWVDNNGVRVYQKSKNGIWTEYKNGKFVQTFKVISENTQTEELVLYAEDNDLYVKLTRKMAFFGDSKDDISNVLSDGKWIKD